MSYNPACAFEREMAFYDIHLRGVQLRRYRQKVRQLKADGIVEHEKRGRTVEEKQLLKQQKEKREKNATIHAPHLD